MLGTVTPALQMWV